MESRPVQRTTCPRCGLAGPPATECRHCGIIYAKYRGDSAPGSEPTRAGAGPPQIATTVSLAPWLWVVAGVLALTVGVASLGRETVGDDSREPVSTAAGAPAESPASTDSPPGDPGRAWPRTSSAAADPPALDPSWGLSPEPEPESVIGLEAAPPASYSYTWYEGSEGYLQGVEEARRESKALAVYFYTDWCPYCRELDRELLQRAKVEDYLKHLVKIRINPEQGTNERGLAHSYGVRGYPSFFIPSGPDDRPTKIARTSRQGRKTPEEFIATLERAVHAGRG
jgi:thiol-disulfide isomerase/thioredoxin